MARAKKIKEVAEEIKHEEVEGQTTLPFIDEEPAQTEEVEEVLTGKDFPHQQKGKGGRPLSTDKKIQMKLYSTVNGKTRLELLANEYGLTSSQFVELVVEKLKALDEKKLNALLGIEKVSEEVQNRLIEKNSSRYATGKNMRGYELNLLRKIQTSKGKFCPAEMAETFAYINHTEFNDELPLVRCADFKNKLSAVGFRLDEIEKICKFINRIIEKYSNDHKIFIHNVMENLWKITDFYCENFTDLEINSKAKKMTVSDQNGLLKLLLGE